VRKELVWGYRFFFFMHFLLPEGIFILCICPAAKALPPPGGGLKIRKNFCRRQKCLAAFAFEFFNLRRAKQITLRAIFLHPFHPLRG
jgi:hypothetical protein